MLPRRRPQNLMFEIGKIVFLCPNGETVQNFLLEIEKIAKMINYFSIFQSSCLPKNDVRFTEFDLLSDALSPKLLRNYLLTQTRSVGLCL